MTETLRYRGAPARRAAILELLNSTGYLSTSEVAERLSVSEMTARRDLRKLVDEGVVSSVRGGIRIAGMDEQGPTEYERRVSTESDAKAVIGRAAVNLIGPHDVVAIDAGTTAFQVAQNLGQDFQGTVVTHSIPVVHLLAQRPSGRVIALGGEVFHPSKALVGSFAVDNVQNLRASILFLGAAGADQDGLFAAADVEKGVKCALMDVADLVVLVIDHRKFTTRAPVLLCDWSRVDVVICDQAPDEELSAVLEANQVELIIPERNTSGVELSS